MLVDHSRSRVEEGTGGSSGFLEVKNTVVNERHTAFFDNVKRNRKMFVGGFVLRSLLMNNGVIERRPNGFNK